MVDPAAETLVQRPSSTTKRASVSERLDVLRAMLVVVVPQHRELAEASLKRREDWLDPLDDIVVFDEIARDEKEVRRPIAAVVDYSLEEPAVEAACEVEVAELDDLQAVERCGQTGNRYLPVAKTKPERLVSGQSQEPVMRAIADQCVMTFGEREIDHSGRTGDTVGPFPPGKVERDQWEDEGAREDAKDGVTAQGPGPVPERVSQMHPEQGA